MSAQQSHTSRGFWLSTALLGVLLGAGVVLSAQTPPQGKEQPERYIVIEDQKIPVYPGGYVGTRECLECHGAEGRAFDVTPHARAWDPRTPAAARSCETCHGPGADHVEDTGAPGKIKAFAKMPPREASATCMSCHNRQEHENWQGSMHDSRNVTCVNCHSSHKAKSERGGLRAETVVESCASCHRDKAAKMMRSGHMPVREGKLDCSSCHSQHGSTNVKLLRVGNTVNEACTSCHAEKRGPFLWEHPPARESCVTCHDPHGSSNDALLVAKAPMLCQRCHIATRHPATIYDGLQVANRSNRVTGRACVNCHPQVHGSNHPSGIRFQR